MTKPSFQFCCKRFKECAEKGEIVRAGGYDETEWYIPEWHHLYFCPFCGSPVKGRGFGKLSKRIVANDRSR